MKAGPPHKRAAANVPAGAVSAAALVASISRASLESLLLRHLESGTIERAEMQALVSGAEARA